MTMALVAYAKSPWAMFVPVALAVPVLVALETEFAAKRSILGVPPVPNRPALTRLSVPHATRLF